MTAPDSKSLSNLASPLLSLWSPSPEDFERSHLWSWMKDLGFKSVREFHSWSATHREEFWQGATQRLGIHFPIPPRRYIEWDPETAQTRHLLDAQFNIAENCFLAPGDRCAVTEEREDGSVREASYAELEFESRRVAQHLSSRLGLKVGDAVAIQMPLTLEAVAIYLGIVLGGFRVVSIADSFAPSEIATRLRIAEARAIFTQDGLLRGGKAIPLYSKVQAAREELAAENPSWKSLPAVVVSIDEEKPVPLVGSKDVSWLDFAGEDPADPEWQAPRAQADAIINVLFSSGTTGEPKAIGWTQSTPLKCGVDALLHHDIHDNDVLCWPTNIGWMMGPWLLFATFLNRASLALFDGAPHSPEFARFVARQKVTMLGVVPSLVKAWKSADVFQGVDLSSIRSFSSTGECSNAEDMAWLSAQAGGRPILEYCGGTEVGGAYMSSTRIEENIAAAFSSKCFGLDFVILDDSLQPARNGELFLIPPSIGFSDSLLNRDHFDVYFRDTPRGPHGQTLRRHGDEVEELANGYFRAHGRSDDTMNLGGIKVSSAEIERCVNQLAEIKESAAIAVNPPGGGPSLLVLALVANEGGAAVNAAAPVELLKLAQSQIRSQLNPLFKVSDVWALKALPRTASNKVLRRVLRAEYLDRHKG